jgi:hypothetical protein
VSVSDWLAPRASPRHERRTQAQLPARLPRAGLRAVPDRGRARRRRLAAHAATGAHPRPVRRPRRRGAGLRPSGLDRALQQQARGVQLPEQRRADGRARARRDRLDRASRAALRQRVLRELGRRGERERAEDGVHDDPAHEVAAIAGASTAARPPPARSPGAPTRSGTASRARPSTSATSRGATLPRSPRITEDRRGHRRAGAGRRRRLRPRPRESSPRCAQALRRGRRAADLRRSAVGVGRSGRRSPRTSTA